MSTGKPDDFEGTFDTLDQFYTERDGQTVEVAIGSFSDDDDNQWSFEGQREHGSSTWSTQNWFKMDDD